MTAGLPTGEMWVHCDQCGADRFVTWLPMPVNSVTVLMKAQRCGCGSKRFGMGKKPRDTAEGDPFAWLNESNDTGISSETIWSVMMGRPTGRRWGPDVPHDPADFGRCYRLLKLMPSWRERLPEVAAKYPQWSKLVEQWDTLTTMYEAALQTPKKPAREMYDLMQRLRQEG